jgi:hypothetical protein
MKHKCTQTHDELDFCKIYIFYIICFVTPMGPSCQVDKFMEFPKSTMEIETLLCFMSLKLGSFHET